MINNDNSTSVLYPYLFFFLGFLVKVARYFVQNMESYLMYIFGLNFLIEISDEECQSKIEVYGKHLKKREICSDFDFGLWDSLGMDRYKARLEPQVFLARTLLGSILAWEILARLGSSQEFLARKAKFEQSI